MFGGAKNWVKIYKLATPERYSFLYMDLAENPPIAYRNFEEVIAIGEKIQKSTQGISADLSDSESDENEKS